jgi:penicillin-insensitive murein endopeptidase
MSLNSFAGAAVAALSAAFVPALTGATELGDMEARRLFGSVDLPAELSLGAVGSYSRGCLAGAVPLPPDGPYHQAMRLSRNRNWGHPELVAYLEDLSKKVHERSGWPGILVGDLAQPRGGPMLSGHASHQIGLDADIWLMPPPNSRYSTQEREEISAVSVLLPGKREVSRAVWKHDHSVLIRAAAEDERVARVFVNPAIKRALCDGEDGDREWLRKIRAWYGHDAHIHVRLHCPDSDSECRNQMPPPPGDGCGTELDWWFTEAPYKRAPAKPKPLRLSDLPLACRTIFEAY